MSGYDVVWHGAIPTAGEHSKGLLMPPTDSQGGFVDRLDSILAWRRAMNEQARQERPDLTSEDDE